MDGNGTGPENVERARENAACWHNPNNFSKNFWVGTSMLLATVEPVIGAAAIRDGCNPLQC